MTALPMPAVHDGGGYELPGDAAQRLKAAGFKPAGCVSATREGWQDRAPLLFMVPAGVMLDVAETVRSAVEAGRPVVVAFADKSDLKAAQRALERAAKQGRARR